MTKSVLALVLCLVAWIHPGLGEECFVAAKCKQSYPISGKLVENQYDCRKECQSVSFCNWFTYHKEASYCELYRNCLQVDKQPCSDCLSGEKECTIPDVKCWLTGKCAGEAFETKMTQTSVECLSKCKATSGCDWFSFDERKGECYMYVNCTDLVGCDNCLSGESKCEAESKESEWHLIIGGAGSPNTVELFNWRTYKHCQLPDLPVGAYGHVAASIKGVPVFCEGGKSRRSCYKMDKATKKWVSIASLLSGVEFAKSILVPSQGWVVFGSLGSSMNRSQVLPSLSEEWKEGPQLINADVHNERQCLFRINDLKTGFINYNRNGYLSNAKELDWSTMTFKDKAVKGLNNALINRFPICTVLNVNDNDHLIVSTAGNNEMFHIKDALTYVSTSGEPIKTLPKNLQSSNSLTQLVAVNNKTELFLYGGQVQDEAADGIWRYSPFAKLWMLVGKMKFPRAGHTVTPVQDLKCP